LLGTLVEIAVRSNSAESRQEAINQAFGAISEVERRMSFHDPSSTLSCLNREAFLRPVQVDDKTFYVLKTAQELYAISGGLFDPTIAPELQQQGFLPKTEPEPLREPVTASFGDVGLLGHNRVRFRHPGVRLDLGGLAKGFAVDEAVAVLDELGIIEAIVNAGGDLRVLGRSPFSVEIRNPWHRGTTIGPFGVTNVAFATSAHYFAERVKPAARRGPFVDPYVRKLSGDLLSVSVIAPTAMIADAITKIVMLSPSGSASVLTQLGAAALICDPSGITLCSPNWNEKLQAAP
jgi:thiamine biosynthesis lipoprotein